MDGSFNFVVLIFEFHDFGIDVEEEPIGRERAVKELMSFLVQFSEQLLNLLRGVGQAEVLHRAQGGFETFGLEEDRIKEFLIGVGQIALVFWKQGRIEAMTCAGSVQLQRSGADMEGAFRSVTIGAVLGMVLEMELAFFKQSGLQELGESILEKAFEFLRPEQRTEELVVL